MFVGLAEMCQGSSVSIALAAMNSWNKINNDNENAINNFYAQAEKFYEIEYPTKESSENEVSWTLNFVS